jgi:hypothetical protein
MSKTLLVFASISSFLFSNVALAQAPSIDGNWKMSFTGENINPTYTLIQRGTSLTGTFRAPIGEFPLTGIVKGNKINFSAKFKGKSLNFAGTINGETMSGVADIPIKGRRNWTASKY